MKLIYHKGTGTYFGLDDSTVIIDLSAHRDIDIYNLADEMDTRGDQIAEQYGQQIRLADNDLTWGNSVSFSPTALRTEARELANSGAFNMLDGEDPAYTVCKWITDQATDADLAMVAEYALQTDHLWDTFQTLWLEAAEVIHRETTKP